MKSLLSFALFFAVPGVVHADIFRILDKNNDAAQARVDLVQQAREEILTSYFIYNNDRAGKYGLALLRQAKRRGVKRIRVILDANFNELDRGMLKHLKDEGIEVKLYHPGIFPVTGEKLMKTAYRMADKEYRFGDETLRAVERMDKRMHDKLLIVDGHDQGFLLTGGRNMKGDYYGAYEKNYDDRDVLVQSDTAVPDARRYFLELFESDHVGSTHFARAATPDEVKLAKLELDVSMLEMADPKFNPHFKLDTCNEVRANEKPVNTVHFIHSEISPDGKDINTNAVSKELIKLVSNAKGTLLIETPYLLPTDTFYKVIRKAIDEKGLYVRVLTNSLGSTDGAEVAGAYSTHKQRLVKMGIDLWEYQGPNYLHAKSGVIDNRIAIIGSYNVDPRSAYLNTEVAVYVDDRAKGEELRKSFERNIGGTRSVQIGRNGEPLTPYLHEPSLLDPSDWIKLLRYHLSRSLADIDVYYERL
ncbi:MAG: phospholipase D family protein [Bdellovibrionales bacterium]|nr:phospholipase D family protein [Bdellovibrionales bacterium]